MKSRVLFLLALFLLNVSGNQGQIHKAREKYMRTGKSVSPMTGPQAESRAEQIKSAIFAGGCFWCIDAIFEQVPGVVSVTSGYTGGHVPHPTYQEVCTGTTGHFEAVLVRYDPVRVSYRDLLRVFWMHIDPTDPGGQFHDRGSQYRTAIFYGNEAEKNLAEESKEALQHSDIFTRPIVTLILPAGEFYPAEDYHQNYYRKNNIPFETFFVATGHEPFVDEVWKNHEQFHFFPKSGRPWMTFQKPSAEKLKKILTPLQYAVTQENATEPPFQNPYWNLHAPGLYVDVVSGEPLFSSTDKFDSGTGWPSFSRALPVGNIVERRDTRLGTVRIEVRSRHGDSHLGHVFQDGPPPTHLRYCMNSAALRFIPVKDLAKEGYREYLKWFQK